MIKILARWWAKRAYLWKLEVEGRNNELHANLAALHAQQKREQVEKLNKDADAIEENIKEVEKRLEVGYWECPNGHEKADALLPEAEGQPRRCLDCKEAAKYMKRAEMSPQEIYEADRGKHEAEKITKDHRDQATAIAKEVTQLEQTAQHFRRESARSRAVADEIRKV